MSLAKNRGASAAKLNGHRVRAAESAVGNAAEKSKTRDGDGAEFPVHVLPKTLKEMATAIADCRQVPVALAAGALLTTVAASIGRGLKLESGPSRWVYPNLFLLASAGSGVGKSTVLNDAVAPIRRLQKDLRGGEIEPQFEVPEKHVPTLTVDDVTGAALPEVMSANGQKVFAVSAEAGDHLKEASKRGSRLKSVLLKGYSNEPIEVHRVSRTDVSMTNPSLCVLWMCQPHRLDDFLAQPHLLESGLLARFLAMHTGGSMTPLSGKEPKIPPEVRRNYEQLVESLFMDYLQHDEKPINVRRSKGVPQVMRDFHNQVVARANGDCDDATVCICICRWPEQAWRLALVLHAAVHGALAHKRELAVSTARNAVRLARWFGAQQLQILNATTLQGKKQRMHKLLRNLQDSPDGQVGFRDLKNSHGFGAEEIEELVEAFPGRFRVEVIQNPNGGPKSRLLCLGDG